MTDSVNGDANIHSLTSELHAHLEATAERPINATANRWLGEAEAVAADLSAGASSPTVVRKRAHQLSDLLGHVDDTGDPEANDHVDAARDLLERIEVTVNNE